MKRSLLSLAVVAMTLLSLAQAPHSFNYQAVVRAADGNILQNTNVSFRFSVLQGSAVGTAVYVETHTTMANQYGVVNVVIGEGSVVSGDFSTITWGGDTYFLKVDMDVNGGSSFTDMTTQQLVAVPYALHARTVSESDNDTTNEHQELSLSGTDLTLTKNGGTVSIADDDSDPTNEIQAMELVGDSLTLSGSNAVGLNQLNHWNLDNIGRLTSQHTSVGIGTPSPSTSYKLVVLSGAEKNHGMYTENIVANNSIATSYTHSLYTNRTSGSGSSHGINNVLTYNPKTGTSGYQTIGFSNTVTSGPDDAALNSTYGIRNTVNRSDSGSGPTYGYYLDLNHSGNDGSAYGAYFDIDATGNSSDPLYGIYSSISKTGTGVIYGNLNYVARSSTTPGNTYGARTSVSYSPTSGLTTNLLDANSILLTTNPTVNIEPRGQYIDVNRGGTGTGLTTGSHIDVRHTTSGVVYGTFNEIERTSTTNTFSTIGLRNLITTEGGGSYGVYTSASIGSASSTAVGTAYGTYNTITRYGALNASVYGGRFYASNQTTGTGTRYAYGAAGVAYFANSIGTGRTYGVYGAYSGSAATEYAGYFSGSVYTTGSYLPSDAKLKQNVSLQASSLDRVLQLKVYNYEYNTDKYAHMNLPEGKQTGFIASDLNSVFPELTRLSHQPPLDDELIETMEKDGLSVGDAARSGLDYTAVNYAGLVPHLTLSIQEQQKMLLEQQDQIADLKEAVLLLRQEVLKLQNQLNK